MYIHSLNGAKAGKSRIECWAYRPNLTGSKIGFGIDALDMPFRWLGSREIHLSQKTSFFFATARGVPYERVSYADNPPHSKSTLVACTRWQLLFLDWPIMPILSYRHQVG